MKQILLITLALTFSLFAQPKIEFVGGNTYDWGSVKPIESPLKARTVIKNTGDEVLRIFRVEPGCGCTTAPLSNDYIQPGDTAILDIKLQIRNNRGKMNKKIDIYTNDPSNKIAVYNLEANIFVAVEVSPNFFAFNLMKVGEETVAKINLINHTDEPITIKRIISSHEDIELDLTAEDQIPAKGSLEVTAKYTPQEAGSFNAAMTFMTDNIELPRIKLSAYGKAEPK